MNQFRPPQRMLALALLLGVAIFGGVLLLILARPWLGLVFETPEAGPGLTVAAVDTAHPNSERIAAGDRLLRLDAPKASVELQPSMGLTEPDTLSYTAFGDFIAGQDAAAAVLAAERIVALRADGSTVMLETREMPLTAVPPSFWLHAFYGLSGLLVTGGIWVFRPGNPATALLALSGLGYFVLNFSMAIYGTRELAIDARLFLSASAINHAGTLLNVFAISAMMWVYPRRLAAFPMVTAMALFGVLAFVADMFRVGGSAVVTCYAPLAASFVLGMLFTALQWRASKERPTDRAAMRWIVLAVLWAALSSVASQILPVVFGMAPLLPHHIGLATVLGMYLGLAAGVSRYRLFDLDRWWLNTWKWVAGGCLVVALDVFMVSVLRLGATESLLTSALIAGFVYFPLRQWLLRRLGASGATDIDRALPQLMGRLIGADTPDALSRRWAVLLGETFQPLETRRVPRETMNTSVSPDGLSMDVPHPQGRDSLRLHYASGGTRLFIQRDLRLGQAFADVGHHAMRAIHARAEGETAAREQMLDDLHDDLGAKLLSVLHTARGRDEQALARSALADLRAVTSGRDPEAMTVQGFLGRLREEFERRTAGTDLILDWQAAADTERLLDGHVVFHAQRIMREALSNVFQHARASQIAVAARADDHRLQIELCDDGIGADLRVLPERGRGARTMQTRAEEIDGRLEVTAAALGGVCVALELRFDA